MTTTTNYTLAQEVTCEALGLEMYQRWAQFYGYTDLPSFQSLSYHTKKLWIVRALEAIEVVGPLRSKVIATISPEEPFGVARADAHHEAR